MRARYLRAWCSRACRPSRPWPRASPPRLGKVRTVPRDRGDDDKRNVRTAPAGRDGPRLSSERKVGEKPFDGKPGHSGFRRGAPWGDPPSRRSPGPPAIKVVSFITVGVPMVDADNPERISQAHEVALQNCYTRRNWLPGLPPTRLSPCDQCSCTDGAARRQPLHPLIRPRVRPAITAVPSNKIPLPAGGKKK